VDRPRRLAVVLFNLGGPDCPEAIKPFLLNLFRDPAILRVPFFVRPLLARIIAGARVKPATENYTILGGKSPLLELTQEQAAALEQALAGPELEVKCFIAMRYWHPFSLEAAKAVRDWGADEVFLLPLYPHFSTTTTGSSLTAWREAAARVGLARPVTTLCCWFGDEAYVAATAAMVRRSLDEALKTEALKTEALKSGALKTGSPRTDASGTDASATDASGTDASGTGATKSGALKSGLREMGASGSDAPALGGPHVAAPMAGGAPVRLLFSAHGLPETIIAKGDPYQFQIETTVQAVVDVMQAGMAPGAAPLDWQVCYQSRATPQKWLDPSTEVAIEEAARDKRAVLVVPIAFVSEHSETLVELDVEYRELAEKMGVPGYYRSPAQNADPGFIAAVAKAIGKARDRGVGLCSFMGERACPANHVDCPLRSGGRG
jgi:protoheme ferro-lyase